MDPDWGRRSTQHMCSLCLSCLRLLEVNSIRAHIILFFFLHLSCPCYASYPGKHNFPLQQTGDCTCVDDPDKCFVYETHACVLISRRICGTHLINMHWFFRFAFTAMAMLGGVRCNTQRQRLARSSNYGKTDQCPTGRRVWGPDSYIPCFDSISTPSHITLSTRAACHRLAV